MAKPTRSIQAFRDGTSQRGRSLRSLAPDYIAVDERSLADWIRFVWKFSQHLNYFEVYPPVSDEPLPDWSAFFAEFGQNAAEIAAAVEAIAAEPPDLEAIATIPDHIRQIIAQPHLALLLTCFKLLQYPQQQFKALTQRRLDFYYRQVLQLQPKPATLDRVHVVFQLAPGQTEHRLLAGTRLSAGQNVRGRALQYAIEAEQVITPARVVSLKSVSIETETIQLAQIHQGQATTTHADPNHTDDTFEAMLRWALGRPQPGDRLPPIVTDDGTETPVTIEELREMFHVLHTAVFQAQDETRAEVPHDLDLETLAAGLDPSTFNPRYLLDQLGFPSLAEFYTCFDIHRREQLGHLAQSEVSLPTESDWQQVYAIVEAAYRLRIDRDRHRALAAVHQSGQYLTAEEAFIQLWQEALGDPDPGDPLPRLDGRAVGLSTLTNLARSDDANHQDYVKHQLYLSRLEYQAILTPWLDHPDREADYWPDIYRLLAVAQARKRRLTYPPIRHTKAIWTRSLAVTDPRHFGLKRSLPPRFTSGSQAELPRFSPFNAKSLESAHKNLSSHVNPSLRPNSNLSPSPSPSSNQNRNRTANASPALGSIENAMQRGNAIGIAIASPLLNLTSGQRTLTFTLTYEHAGFDRDRITALITQGHIPLTIELSSKLGWLTAPLTRDRIQVEADSIRLVVELDATDPAIVPLPHEAINPEIATAQELRKRDLKAEFQTSDPLAKITLNETITTDAAQATCITAYPAFKNANLKTVQLQVSVSDLDGVTLRNDRAPLNPRSLFEPFGNQPLSGASLYFFHPELVAYPLDALTLHLGWMGLPADFADHYATYHACGLSPDLSNTSFTVTPGLLIDRHWTEADARSLFTSPENSTVDAGDRAAENPTENSTENPTENSTVDRPPLPARQTLEFTQADCEQLFANHPANHASVCFNEPIATDLFDQSRYFRLELNDPDFQHSRYPLVLNQVAIAGMYRHPANNSTSTPDDTPAATAEPLRSPTVYPPYTPRLKSFSVSYRTSTTLTPGQSDTTSGQLFQVHPFGYTPLRPTQRHQAQQHYAFLPSYEPEGSLYLGITQLQPNQKLSLLFQLVAGSGDADRTPPIITWSYLTDTGWQGLTGDQIVADRTHGLLESGILQVLIPETASDRNPLMPLGLHWLRASVTEQGAAIPDLLEVQAQAATARFIEHDHNSEQSAAALPPYSLQKLVERQTAIARVDQPYRSFGGRRSETDSAFYTRVCERLRHKQRAVTPWDYERLVLEQFPQIYKVKCLTPADAVTDPATGSVPSASAAQVTVVVIPQLSDIARSREPKAPQHLLRKIETYLQAIASPFVQVVAKNPHYEPIQYRLAVRLREGFEPGFYLNQLDQDLVQFLSPWVTDETSELDFSRSIHSSAVVHFLETRPYVDYIAKLKLIQQNIGSGGDRYTVSTGSTGSSSTASSEPTRSSNPLTPLNPQSTPENLAQATTADAILVSAPNHEIDLITDSHYEDEEFDGLGYMMVGLDFMIE